jgi:hypothetical protein
VNVSAFKRLPADSPLQASNTEGSGLNFAGLTARVMSQFPGTCGMRSRGMGTWLHRIVGPPNKLMRGLVRWFVAAHSYPAKDEDGAVIGHVVSGFRCRRTFVPPTPTDLAESEDD